MNVQNRLNAEGKSLFDGGVNVENLFQLAIDSANEGYKLKAMNIARECIIFAKQQRDYNQVYIHGFLAVINMEVKKFSAARIHIYHALNRLNKAHVDYETDLQYFNALQRKIEEKDTPIATSEIAA